MTNPDPKLTYTEGEHIDTPTLEGYKQLVRSLHRGDNGGTPMTATEIATELGMDGKDGAWSVKDVEDAIR